MITHITVTNKMITHITVTNKMITNKMNTYYCYKQNDHTLVLQTK